MPFQWDPVKIGGGGLTSGIQVHADGTRICKTDGTGCYKWDGSEWVYLPTNSAMPPAYTGINPSSGYGMSTGCYEFVVAPSNSSRMWLAYLNNVFTSVDGGANWTDTFFRQFAGFTYPGGGAGWAAGVSGNTRFDQRKMAVDPANEAVCFLGSAVDSLGAGTGVYYTLDGGGHWNLVPATQIPVPIADASSKGTYLIAFDSTQGTSGGRSNGIFVFVYGHGLYRSTNGGSSWAQVGAGSGPTKCRAMTCDLRGRVWVAVGPPAANAGWLWNGSAWIQEFTGSTTVTAVDVKPGASAGLDTIVFLQIDGNIHWSTNGGANWTASGGVNLSVSPGDPSWLANSGFLTATSLSHDPITDRWYAGNGVGVAYVPALASPVHHVFETRGIEDLDGWWVTFPPGGALSVSMEDRSVARVPDPTFFASGFLPPTASGVITWGYHVAYDPTNPRKMVAITQHLMDATDLSGYSTDGGISYSSFASHPTPFQRGGSMAVVGNVIFWSPGDPSGVARVSTDNGGTWNPAAVGSIPITGQTDYGWANGSFTNRHVACADDGGNFYIHNGGNSAADTVHSGVYWSPSGLNGTWTQIFKGFLTGSRLGDYASGNRLQCVPGQVGHVWFSSSGNGMWRCLTATAGGIQTWQHDARWTQVKAMGWGKSVTGRSYPSMFAVGTYNGVYGIYRADDADAATVGAIVWNYLTTWPLDMSYLVNVIGGDPVNPGWFYTDTTNAGFAYWHDTGNTAAGSVTESGSAASTASGHLHSVGSVTEIASASSSASVIVNSNSVSLTEAAAATSTASASVHATRSRSEAAAAASSASISVHAVASRTERAAAFDYPSQSASPPIAVTARDRGFAADAPSVTAIMVASASATAAAADAPFVVPPFQVSASDVIFAIDAPMVAAIRVASASAIAHAIDASSMTAIMVASASDALAAADHPGLPSPIAVTASDGLTALDAPFFVSDILVSASDALTATDMPFILNLPGVSPKGPVLRADRRSPTIHIELPRSAFF
jgi:hypothetical protein